MRWIAGQIDLIQAALREESGYQHSPSSLARARCRRTESPNSAPSVAGARQRIIERCRHGCVTESVTRARARLLRSAKDRSSAIRVNYAVDCGFEFGDSALVAIEMLRRLLQVPSLRQLVLERLGLAALDARALH
jgi:hypothetical protein